MESLSFGCHLQMVLFTRCKIAHFLLVRVANTWALLRDIKTEVLSTFSKLEVHHVLTTSNV